MGHRTQAQENVELRSFQLHRPTPSQANEAQASEARDEEAEGGGLGDFDGRKLDAAGGEPSGWFQSTAAKSRRGIWTKYSGETIDLNKSLSSIKTKRVDRYGIGHHYVLNDYPVPEGNQEQ